MHSQCLVRMLISLTKWQIALEGCTQWLCQCICCMWSSTVASGQWSLSSICGSCVLGAGKWNKHVDGWDAIQDNTFPSLEGFVFAFSQMFQVGLSKRCTSVSSVWCSRCASLLRRDYMSCM